MNASDSNLGFRQRLLDVIDRSGVSARRLSLLATGSADTVRNMRRGSSPRLDTLEVLCRALGFRLEMVPLDEPAEPPEGPTAVEKRPEWSRRLRGGNPPGTWSSSSPAPAKGTLGRTDRSKTTGERAGGTRVCQTWRSCSTGQIWGSFFRRSGSKFQVPHRGELRT